MHFFKRYSEGIQMTHLRMQCVMISAAEVIHDSWIDEPTQFPQPKRSMDQWSVFSWSRVFPSISGLTSEKNPRAAIHFRGTEAFDRRRSKNYCVRVFGCFVPKRVRCRTLLIDYGVSRVWKQRNKTVGSVLQSVWRSIAKISWASREPADSWVGSHHKWQRNGAAKGGDLR